MLLSSLLLLLLLLLLFVRGAIAPSLGEYK